jgi:hypothetical protein
MTKEIREENFSEKEMHLCYNSLQEGWNKKTKQQKLKSK